MLVDIQKVKEVVAEPWSDQALRPLLLFKGNLNEGRARRYLNFVRSMMLAETPNATEIRKLSLAENDVAHLSGLHAKWGWERMSMQSFFYRTLSSPSILDRVTGLEDYLQWVIENTPHFYPYAITPISEISLWKTNRPWRRLARKERVPIAEFYPFISKTPTEDHELLLAVDALVPKTLLNETRADVCQDMIVAILTGETTLDNLRDSPREYVKRFFRQSPSKYNHLSLETPFGNSSEGGRVKTVGEMIV